MLRPEDAKARLAEWQLPEDEDRLAAGIAKLPAPLAKLARQLYPKSDEESDDAEEVGEDAQPDDWETRHERVREAAIKLDGLPVRERAKLFGVISPKLAPAMEQTWQLLATTPYQVGYERKAFRVPGDGKLAAEGRSNWLSALAEVARRFRPHALSPAWLAAWAPHLSEDWNVSAIGPLLAAVLNEDTPEADEVFEILRLSLINQHEIGGMGRHVYTAFLLSNRKAGWELIEKTLLAAQRQEGLRQAILEAIDETHPEAFRRMLRLILDHDLIRFSSVVRAVDVWFGHLWAAASGGVIKKMLTQVVEYLEDEPARQKALGGKDAQNAFLALWCLATEDALASIAPAQKLLASKSVEMRYVAARHLANLDFDQSAAALVPALADEDLRVALLAIPEGRYSSSALAPGLKQDDRFEHLEKLLARVPEKSLKLKPLVWPWTETTFKQSQAADALVETRGKRPATRLVPYLSKLEPYSRAWAAQEIISDKPWSAAAREAILELAGDSAAPVRETALKALADEKLVAAEVMRLEDYLTRKTSDLRRGVMELLLKQKDSAALASGERLLAAKDGSQRLAGLELLRLMTEAKRSLPECRAAAEAYRAARKKVTKDEETHLAEIAKDKVAVATLEDALGLMNPADRTPAVAPRNLKTPFTTPAALACLKSLDDLVHKHREANIRTKDYNGKWNEEILGTLDWGFPSPDTDKPRDKQRDPLPLAELWLDWHAQRGKNLKDKDGLELVRALAWVDQCDEWEIKSWKAWAKGSPERKKAAETIAGGQEGFKLRYQRIVQNLLEWLLFLHPVDAADYLLDAIETSYSLVPADEMALLGKPEIEADEAYNRDWREAKAWKMWNEALDQNVRLSGRETTVAQDVRRYRLLAWRDEPFKGARRRRVEISSLIIAYLSQAANLADVADHLLGPRGAGTYSAEGFDLLAAITARKRGKEFEDLVLARPELQQLVDRAVARILELELGRGDAATAATQPAYALSALSGIETLRRVLHALGEADFKLGRGWREADRLDRRQTLTHLVKVTFPAEQETPEQFTQAMKAAVMEGQFPEERLLQLTFLAPQWVKFVEAYFGWEQMSEGVYWFLAHMRYVWGVNAILGDNGEADDDSGEETDDEEEVDVDADDDSSGMPGPSKPRKLSAWERLIVERTPLTDAERNEGAIDVAWFRRTHEQLGEKHWQALATAARFAANASQAKRAQFIADVLLNKVKRKELISGIQKKQLKEHVRLLGLLPLEAGKKRDADLLERCQVLREYRRYANTLSGLTKPDALRAWDIGMKNLAQTAGYPDPLRLEWAVGAETVKDLLKGPISATAGGVTVTLSLDELSKPEVTYRRPDKELKSLPPAVKKDKKVAELLGRVTDLRRQASAIRQSLEGAMCRGDAFLGDELRAWCGHALLAPLLSRLVVVGEGILGYPDKGGKALRDERGKLEPVKPNEKLRLAHSHDLLESDNWHAWQRECFQAERVQPFKQVFRELYVLTKQEKKDGDVSHRYDGQQVQPRQALALFGSRGWNTSDGVFKVFHDLGLVASVNFQTGVTTPAEVEGAAFDGVRFTKRNEWKPQKLTAVPPRLFSEVMRDLDLVVSVAHAGGVDPEASASTVEMRSGLLRETCALLNLKNVRLKPMQAVIDGELTQYSVHLGSGTVHKLPGGSLCIVPVHAQHRGRLFLPFADDDPRTAEVVSKVLLLANDREIQDPTILEQIRR